MDEDATWYGSRPQPRPHRVRRGPSFPLPSSPARKRHNAPSFLAHVYCCHGRPSQLLLSSCTILTLKIGSEEQIKVSTGYSFVRYGDSAGNVIEEKSSVYSVI